MAASCLNECLANSPTFLQHFREFWNLDEGFTRICSEA
jgi:hypothetical protein